MATVGAQLLAVGLEGLVARAALLPAQHVSEWLGPGTRPRSISRFLESAALEVLDFLQPSVLGILLLGDDWPALSP